MKIQEYKNKIIISLALLIVLTIVIMLFLRYENAGEQGKSEEVKAREKAITELDPSKMSRISFFNATPDRASLAIPEWWEGKYRIRESGDVVIFSYVNKTGDSLEFFIIKKYPDFSWQEDDPIHKNLQETKIMKKKNTDYSYYLSSVINDEKSSEKEFVQMQNELALVIQTIK
jgi:hypothetical protein